MDKITPYKPVNWINGMKINKTHFIAEHNAQVFMQALSNNAFLNDHNYGVLPRSSGERGTKIWLSLDNTQHVNLRMLSCLAITRGGYIIDISSGEADGAQPLAARIPGLSQPFESLKGRSDAFYVVLSVDPYNPEPAGAANPEEQPVRLPFTQPKYSVVLMEEQETSLNTLGAFQLPVGKLQVKDQTVILVEDYIPACTTVNSDERLIRHQAETEQFFGKLELDALQILQKIIQKNQQNDLIAPLSRLCEQVLTFIATIFGSYKQHTRYNPPIELFTATAGLARTIKNALDIYAGAGKEDLINYFTEWCNVKQGELEDSLTEICNYRYDHLNIHQGIRRNTEFCGLIISLFDTLAGLDYIGKKREAGIFVKEQAIIPDEEMAAKRRGFFLAD
ncbi:hypothetical protein GCM10027051_15250 [Niabella terrae]